MDKQFKNLNEIIKALDDHPNENIQRAVLKLGCTKKDIFIYRLLAGYNS